MNQAAINYWDNFDEQLLFKILRLRRKNDYICAKLLKK